MLHAATAIVSGLVICAIGILVLLLAWPTAYLTSDIAILISPKKLAIVALANSVVLVSAYVAVAALVWAVADAAMGAPRNLEAFDETPREGRSWRIAHLSDLHIVGERYGFRLESGRSGARGNQRVRRVFEQLELRHADEPLDLILITGDMTDAGRSSEWAEFFDAVADHPILGNLILLIPGNHDVNIVDRANPARLDLPTSPNKRLRKCGPCLRLPRSRVSVSAS
jgi:predicted MPP superfamily phosphohydrolase